MIGTFVEGRWLLALDHRAINHAHLPDKTLWLWIYDQKGAIQSCGLDFIQDFTRFGALLVALQRFNRQDWGFHSELEPPARINPTVLIELTFTTQTTAITSNLHVQGHYHKRHPI